MIDCVICNKEITKKDKILAFGEVEFNSYEWDYANQFDNFDEIIPKDDYWFLAHFYCIFKKPSSDNNVSED